MKRQTSNVKREASGVKREASGVKRQASGVKIFDVQGEEYAVNIGYVTEIVGVQRISEVLDVPEYIKGVINLQGKVIPMMDVGMFV